MSTTLPNQVLYLLYWYDFIWYPQSFHADLEPTLKLNPDPDPINIWMRIQNQVQAPLQLDYGIFNF